MPYKLLQAGNFHPNVLKKDKDLTFCQTSVLGQVLSAKLGLEWTLLLLSNNKNNNDKKENPHLNFTRRNSTTCLYKYGR